MKNGKSTEWGFGLCWKNNDDAKVTDQNDQPKKKLVPPFKDLTASIDKLKDIEMPQMPESERCNLVKAQLSEKKLVL